MQEDTATVLAIKLSKVHGAKIVRWHLPTTLDDGETVRLTLSTGVDIRVSFVKIVHVNGEPMSLAEFTNSRSVWFHESYWNADNVGTVTSVHFESYASNAVKCGGDRIDGQGSLTLRVTLGDQVSELVIASLLISLT
ncbi:hypothetical protein FI667_g8542, partial [Globisporangium splendens]